MQPIRIPKLLLIADVLNPLTLMCMCRINHVATREAIEKMVILYHVDSLRYISCEVPEFKHW